MEPSRLYTRLCHAFLVFFYFRTTYNDKSRIIPKPKNPEIMTMRCIQNVMSPVNLLLAPHGEYNLMPQQCWMAFVVPLKLDLGL